MKAKLTTRAILQSGSGATLSNQLRSRRVVGHRSSVPQLLLFLLAVHFLARISSDILSSLYPGLKFGTCDGTLILILLLL